MDLTIEQPRDSYLVDSYLVDSFLYDGDIIAFMSASAVQKDIDWGDGLWTCHAYLDDAIARFEENVATINEALKESLEVNKVKTVKWNAIKKYFIFSSSKNFRKDLNKEYKAQRITTRKPTCYKALVEWVLKNYSGDGNKPYENLEGDDLVSINATAYRDTSVIISKDKDFKTVPYAYFFNFNTNTLVYNNPERAYRNLMIQVLTGDTADNYKGCPKMGAVRAKKLIDSIPCVLDLWNAVVKAYEDNGSTKEDALLNYQMAHLVNFDEYCDRTYVDGVQDTSYRAFCGSP